LEAAIKSIDQYEAYQVIYMSPKGKLLKQEMLQAYEKTSDRFIIVSGCYEGVDSRFFDLFDVTCISIGDYVLSSGDLPGLVFAEGLMRLMPSYAKSVNAVHTDSFVSGLLEPRRYTRPENLYGHRLPAVLCSGNHQEIKAWNKRDAIRETLEKRPELLCKEQKQVGQEELRDVLKEMSEG